MLVHLLSLSACSFLLPVYMFTQLQQHGDLFALAFRLLCLESNSVFIYHQSQSLKLGKLQSYSFGDA